MAARLHPTGVPLSAVTFARRRIRDPRCGGWITMLDGWLEPGQRRQRQQQRMALCRIRRKVFGSVSLSLTVPTGRRRSPCWRFDVSMFQFHVSWRTDGS